MTMNDLPNSLMEVLDRNCTISSTKKNVLQISVPAKNGRKNIVHCSINLKKKAYLIQFIGIHQINWCMTTS